MRNTSIRDISFTTEHKISECISEVSALSVFYQQGFISCFDKLHVLTLQSLLCVTQKGRESEWVKVIEKAKIHDNNKFYQN